jgi:O-antigen ligase
MYWPVGGLLAACALSVAAGDLHPKLTPGLMLMSLGVFALPWLCTSVVLEPGSRRLLALVIMLTPLLSVAIGAFMTAAGIHSSFPEWHRLQGATGNPGAFAILAFTGFAVALHEISRPKRPFAGALAVINLALVILSGARMAIAAAGVFLTVYLMLSTTLRQRLVEHRAKTTAGIAVVAATFLWYWPTLEARLFDGDSVATVSIGATDVSPNLSGRDDVWQFYFEEFRFSPLFGRGVGTGFVAATD